MVMIPRTTYTQMRRSPARAAAGHTAKTPCGMQDREPLELVAKKLSSDQHDFTGQEVHIQERSKQNLFNVKTDKEMVDRSWPEETDGVLEVRLIVDVDKEVLEADVVQAEHN